MTDRLAYRIPEWRPAYCGSCRIWTDTREFWHAWLCAKCITDLKDRCRADDEPVSKP